MCYLLVFDKDCFELGVILTRKRLYTQATKNLEKAKKIWDGEESELAQVCALKNTPICVLK
jgi:nucleoside phosphorylase